MLKSDLYKLNVCFFTGNIQLPLALNINMHHVHQTDHYKVKCVTAMFALFLYTVALGFPRILFYNHYFNPDCHSFRRPLAALNVYLVNCGFSRTLGFYGLHRPIHQN